MTPIIPSMPGHRSVRPYTVFELEQIRQQSRKYGTVGACAGEGWEGAEMTPEWGPGQGSAGEGCRDDTRVHTGSSPEHL